MKQWKWKPFEKIQLIYLMYIYLLKCPHPSQAQCTSRQCNIEWNWWVCGVNSVCACQKYEASQDIRYGNSESIDWFERAFKQITFSIPMNMEMLPRTNKMQNRYTLNEQVSIIFNCQKLDLKSLNEAFYIAKKSLQKKNP